MKAKNKIIEKVENILYEYGWITRPHGDETDDLLNDLSTELASLQGEQEQSEREEEYKMCPQCNKKTGKTYLLSRLPTICQNCDHAWLIG